MLSTTTEFMALYNLFVFKTRVTRRQTYILKKSIHLLLLKIKNIIHTALFIATVVRLQLEFNLIIRNKEFSIFLGRRKLHS